jgi:hypothetical protein
MNRLSASEIEYLLGLLDEDPEDDRELLEEMSSLREAVNDLEAAINEVASMLHDAFHPKPFPEPLRDGPPPPERELSYNGLVEFSTDVPF